MGELIGSAKLSALPPSERQKVAKQAVTLAAGTKIERPDPLAAMVARTLSKDDIAQYRKARGGAHG
jgi:hypothetical protein